jgi:hypothetical protein
MRPKPSTRTQDFRRDIMTEIFHPEPIDPQALRFAVVTELIAYKPLLAHLDVEGLLVLRARLREPELVATCAIGNLAEMRRDTLDVVCRYLVAHEYAPALYFTYIGEMFPITADDASEIDEVP